MGWPGRNDGSIQRVDLDGGNITTIVPEGATFTPKQLKLDRQNGKLYWSDREGMRVMRANLDGSNIETLVERGYSDADRRDETNWCVGIAVDLDRGQIYWTQKGPAMPIRAGCFEPISKYQRAKIRQEEPTSKSFSEICLSRSISISISQAG